MKQISNIHFNFLTFESSTYKITDNLDGTVPALLQVIMYSCFLGFYACSCGSTGIMSNADLRKQ